MLNGPRIRLLAVGGTIASVPRGGAAEVTPSLRAAELVESLPQLAEVAAVEFGDIATVASYAITVADMHAIARAVLEAFDEGCDGVVVTHGTDTLEETAYALALMVPRGRPVVLTGAVRNPFLPGSDGPANLLAAVRTATVPEVGALGPVVVLNDELHAARFVQKTHTTRISTFASPGAGPVGEVVEGRVHVWFRPAYEDYLGLPDTVGGVAVELVGVAAGIGERLFRLAVAARPAGVVVAGTGGGHLPPPLLPALDDAVASGVPVVVASRCAAGRNLERTYRMPGAETDLIERGAIPAGGLSAAKARLRLLVGLALGREPETLFPV